MAARLWPTFIVFGAPKAGTTALYQWLGQHPDIYMSPVKQPHFFAGLDPHFSGPGDELFNRDIVTNADDYLRLFEPGASARARGEASPFYLHFAQTAAPAAAVAIPDCRIVVLLREPVSRAYSGYLHLVRDGRESRSFEEALEREAQRAAAGWEPLWAHRALGRYATQLAALYRAFPQQQVGVWLYDEMRQDPARLFREICTFIGADASFAPRFTRHNTGGAPRNARLHALLVKLRAPHIAKAVLPEGVAQWVVGRYLQHRAPDDEVAAGLREYYRDEVAALAEMLPGKDLSRWR